MKHISMAILSCFMIFPAGGAFAEEYKIGAVNTIRILEQSPQAVAADKLIKEEFSARDRRLVKAQKELKSKEERFAKDKDIVKDFELKKLEREIVNLRRELKRDQDEFREDINFRFNEVRSEIQKEVFDAIVEVAEKNGYDIVFFDGVAYAGPKVDISDLIIEFLKKRQEK